MKLKVQKETETFSIEGITKEELNVIYKVILSAQLPDRRYLYNLKYQMENEIS